MADENGTQTTTTETGGEGEGKQEQQTFTQSDLDKVVKDRVARERAKFADYDDLKSKAEGAKSVEQKLADLEGKYSAAEARALRSDIAAKHGISAEDRDLFLTGTDEETLTNQAARLAAREADRKKHGNVAPTEGETKQTGKPDQDIRSWTKSVWGDAD